MKHPLQAVFLILVLLALSQAAWQHSRLPPRVAIHFNATGRPDAWAPPEVQTTLHIGTVLFMAALIEGLVLIQTHLPVKLVNLPHRDYWLAPERAAATQAWLVGSVLAMGCALMVFFIGLFHLLYRANLDPVPRLTPGVWWLVGGLVAVVLGSLLRLLTRFGRRPAA
ncbi:MAG TPA: DUF1648 domain-containing protein [Lacunisphaera sp.]|nr:DUF1648 domain-containing protein [Lacunisphaera sp.]